MRYVIVGHSFAALFAIESIRRVDPDGEIIVVSDEGERVYSRAMIHEYLAGHIDEAKLHLRDEDFEQTMRVTRLAGRRAERLDPHKAQVTVDGEVLDYDKLLLAVGASAFIPPGIGGLDRFGDSVFTFTRLSDAKQLIDKVQDLEHVVVLGAGLIGMQAADALAHLGKQVHVVELADQILPLTVDRVAAEMIQNELQGPQISFHIEDTVTELIGDEGHLCSVVLRSGQTLPAEAMVIAVGVRPNVQWLEGSGLRIDRGIVVDEHMQTNLENVFAAGDCAAGLDRISGEHRVLATIPIASEQGLVAGYNMAGVAATYRGGIALNALQFAHLQVASYGQIHEADKDEVISTLDEQREVYKRIILRDNHIIGALFVRAIDGAGLFRYLIENAVDVSAFKSDLLSDHFGPASLSSDVRERMFATRRPRIDIPQYEQVTS